MATRAPSQGARTRETTRASEHVSHSGGGGLGDLQGLTEGGAAEALASVQRSVQRSAAAGQAGGAQGGAPPQVPVNRAAVLALQRRVGNRAVTQLVQRAGSAAPAGPTPAAIAARRRALDLTGEIEGNRMGPAAYTALRAQLKVTTYEFLGSRETRSIRDSMKTQAKNRITANLKGRGTEAQQKDALAYVEQLFGGQADALTKVMDEHADKVADEKAPRAVEDEFKAKVTAAFGAERADPTKAEAKQAAAAKAAAQRDVSALQAQKQTDATTAIKTAIRAKLNDATFLKAEVETKIGTAGQEEIQKRIDLEGKLVNAEDVNKIYTDAIVTPMEAAVVKKLGVGRGAWRRSDELNAFRQTLKDAAREQAHNDAAVVIGNNAATNTSELKKQYYAMLADKQAYTKAKGSVDDVMRAQATEIVKEVVPDAATKEELTAAGKSAAYPTARTSKNADQDKAKIFTAAKTGAVAKATEIVAKKQPDAIDKARTIVKGSKKAGGPAKDAAKQATLKTGVEQKVTEQRIGEKSVTAAIESNSMNSGLAKVGGLIDFAVPNAGEGCQLAIDLKIPIPGATTPGGKGYFLFGFVGKAERDASGGAENLKVSSEITFGIGFDTFGFDMNARFGVFVEAQGAKTTDALNLVSYGLYRQMRNISTAAAEHFWSETSAVGPKKGKRSKAEEAELWAAMVEQEAMGNDGYVDIGVLARVAAKANAKVFEAEAKLGAKRVRHYSKAVIEKLTKTPTGRTKFGSQLTADDLKADALRDRAQAIDAGELRGIFEVSAEAKAKWFHDQAITFGLEGKFTRFNGTTQGVEIAAKGAMPFTFGEEGMQIAEWVARVGPGIASGIKNIVGIYKAQADTETKKRVGGAVTEIGTDAFFSAKGGSDGLATSFVNKLQQDNAANDTIRSWMPGEKAGATAIEKGKAIGMESVLECKLVGKLNWDPDTNKLGEWEIGLEVAQVKKLEVNASLLGGLKVAAEKSKRLGKLNYNSKNGVTGGLVGIEKS